MNSLHTAVWCFVCLTWPAVACFVCVAILQYCTSEKWLMTFLLQSLKICRKLLPLFLLQLCEVIIASNTTSLPELLDILQERGHADSGYMCP